jgi:hypothetical protein
MSKDELQEIGRWLEKNRGYSKCKFTIELETMYILPAGVLCYRTMDVDCGLAYEVSEIYCNKDYLRIDYLNHDSDYFKRLKPSFDSNAFTIWQNYKDPYIEQQKIDEEKDKIRSKGFVLNGDVENFYCEPENITIDGYAIEEKLLSKYPDISKRTFHIRLKKLGILDKPNYKWIFTENGLQYGYNLIIGHTYNQDIQNFPCFYCDANSKEFIKYSQTTTTKYGDILYPDCIALYNISKFKQLMELIELEEKRKKQKKNLNKKSNAYEPQKDKNGNILKCPKCLSDHLHKKGKRTLSKKIIQRYQCQTCNKIFSVTLKEL